MYRTLGFTTSACFYLPKLRQKIRQHMQMQLKLEPQHRQLNPRNFLDPLQSARIERFMQFTDMLKLNI